MTRALVIGATGGIGAAVAAALEARGTEVTRLSRTADGLDVTDATSVEAAMGRLEGPFDLVFVAVGALTPAGQEPEKAVKEITADAMSAAFMVNAAGPMLLLKHALPLIHKDARSVIAILSARVGSIGDNAIGGWHSYRASKAALNQFVHGTAVEMKRTHKQGIAVVLHPGTVATPFTEKYASRHRTTPAPEAATNLLGVIDGLATEHSGRFFDYAGKEIPW